MTDDIHKTIFDKLDGHAVRLSGLETHSQMADLRLGQMESRTNEVLKSMAATETKLLERMDVQGRIVQEIRDQELRREGGKNLGKFLVGGLGLLLLIMQIVTLSKTL